MSNASIQSTPEENGIREEIGQLILSSFTNNQENCRVILQESEIYKIADLILANSTTEPCGVYGCTLSISLQTEIPGQKKLLKSHRFGDSLGTAVAATHEIDLILVPRQEPTKKQREEQSKIFSKIKQYLQTTFHSTREIRNPTYRIEKKRLYRSVKPSANHSPMSSEAS